MSQPAYEVGSVIVILLLQTKKLKHVGVKNLAQGHTAKKWQCQGSNPDRLASESPLFPTMLCTSRRWTGEKQATLYKWQEAKVTIPASTPHLPFL